MKSYRLHVGGKWKLVYYFLTNISVIILIVSGIFLILPGHIQDTISTGIYIIAGISGLIIGTMAAKIISLNEELHEKVSAWRKRHENIHEYIGNVVHDLRSPVASINMIAEVLDNELNNIDPTYKELIRSVKKSTHAMLDRICCILDNSKIEKGIKVDNIQPGNPFNVLIDVIKKHQILAIEKDIKISVNIPPNVQACYFDGEALDNVFSNLISNAIKYSLPKTKIEIYHKLSNGTIEFFVKDQGLGMTEDDLSKVFGEYAKLSARPTHDEPSTGLGLSIVKKLVEQMDGEVNAESEGKNMGSVFSFKLKTLSNVRSLSA
ncbi:MAG: HAMP domain-containing histidine kinase [Prolixibacteraceae bacterium]|nr:HAMP domain-containing histidine kinase [Prolixibacteraceae bacterium]